MNIFWVFSIIVSAAIRHFQAAVLFLVPAKERGGKGSPSRKAVSSTRPFFRGFATTLLLEKKMHSIFGQRTVYLT